MWKSFGESEPMGGGKAGVLSTAPPHDIEVTSTVPAMPVPTLANGTTIMKLLPIMPEIGCCVEKEGTPVWARLADANPIMVAAQTSALVTHLLNLTLCICALPLKVNSASADSQ